MKKLILILGFLFLSSFNSNEFRYVKNEAFGLGETLEYDVFTWFKAGTGYFKVMPEPIMINNRKCYDIRFEVRSLSSLEWIYKVRDRYETAVDIGGIFPHRFEQIIREGGYKRNSKTVFDQKNKLAYSKKDTFEVPEYVHDVVSAFYYIRTMDVKNFPNDTSIYLKNFFDDSTYTLEVKVLGREKVKVAAGEFNCVKIEPLVKKGGLFKHDGRLFIWLTDDDRKIPVKVGTKIIIGFVGAELKRYKGVRGDVNAKIN